MPMTYTKNRSAHEGFAEKTETTRMCEELASAGYQFMCLLGDDGYQIVLDGPRYTVFKPFATDDAAIAHAHRAILESKSLVIDCPL